MGHLCGLEGGGRLHGVIVLDRHQSPSYSGLGFWNGVPEQEELGEGWLYPVPWGSKNSFPTAGCPKSPPRIACGGLVRG
jgi:hypothetical protein